MIFKYQIGTGPDDRAVGFVNSDFVVHVEEVRYRGEGREAKAHLLGGGAAVARGEYAERLLEWYEAQAEPKPQAPREPARKREPVTA